MKPWSVKALGQGEPLVMFHGWAMNGEVMSSFAEELAVQYRVTLADLPGHGRQADEAPWTLDEAVDQWAQQCPEPAVYVGWSLGGMLALRLAARYPERVRKLVLLAASPRFVAAEDWPLAQSADLFDAFAAQIESDRATALLRFLLIQSQGLAQLKRTVQILKQALQRGGEATLNGLRSGLDILRGADLRTDLAGIECPVRMVLGERDSLVPAGVLAQARALQPGLQGRVIEGAAHQPFISHQQDTAEAVLDFCRAEPEAVRFHA